MDSDALADAIAFARQRKIAVHQMLVIRHGHVVLDAAFHPYAAGTRHDIASITKSVTSLLVGIASAEGVLGGMDQRIGDVLPFDAFRRDARKAATTLGDLLYMRSGSHCDGRPREAQLREMKQREEWVRYAAEIPQRSAPGTVYAYCSPSYHLLSAALQRSTGMTAAEYARTRLFVPLGITDVHWPADPQGTTRGWGDLQLRPRDLAKLGLLLLHGGRWDGVQLVPDAWLRATFTPRSTVRGDDAYGAGWWLHPVSRPGFFEAVGRGGQRLSVWPRHDLVVVLLGGGFEPDDVAPFLGRAVRSDSPVAPNPAAHARLLREVAAAAAAPPASAPSESPTAAVISGRTFDLEANSLGLRSLTMEFPGGTVATARLAVAGLNLVLPVGLDGRPRIGGTPVDGIAPASRGVWRGRDEFVLDLDLVGKVDRYTLAMTFDRQAERVRVRLTEATGLAAEEVGGVARR